MSIDMETRKLIEEPTFNDGDKAYFGNTTKTLNIIQIFMRLERKRKEKFFSYCAFFFANNRFYIRKVKIYF